MTILGGHRWSNSCSSWRSVGTLNGIKMMASIIVLGTLYPSSIDLLLAFPRVLIMDCTYKANGHQLPLFEIVGVTSTEKTFSVAFAYLSSENEKNYTWVLENLRSVMDDVVLLQVVVTDRELALMNSLRKVFPMPSHLLCRSHISRNILANCKKMFKSKLRWEDFISMWNVMVLAETEEDYGHYLSELETHFHRYTQAVDHCKEQWLLPYKKFVAAWMDKLMDLGNTTTNGVESAHLKLKRQLDSFQGDFEVSWSKFHAMLALQYTDIKASFEISLTSVHRNLSDPLYTEVRGRVSKAALCIIYDEANRSENVGVGASACGCVYRQTHGLPCAHEISLFKLVGCPIPLSCIDCHWRKLDLLPLTHSNEGDVSYFAAIELVHNRFRNSDHLGRQELVRKLIKLANSILDVVTQGAMDLNGY